MLPLPGQKTGTKKPVFAAVYFPALVFAVFAAVYFPALVFAVFAAVYFPALAGG